jgi:hypothetical protein
MPLRRQPRKETTVASLSLPQGRARRAVLGSLALAAVGGPIVIARAAANAGTTKAAKPPAPKAGTALWAPNPKIDGLRAFEGIEVNRANVKGHADSSYIVVEDDHYRFNIFKTDRDSTGGGDRQRTEAKGTVADGKMLQMRGGETWRLVYEMFIPSTLRGTSHFTHLFQIKTPGNNGGPYFTVSLSRNGSGERLRFVPDSSKNNAEIGSVDLNRIRNKWVTVDMTFLMSKNGTAHCVLRDGVGPNAPVLVDKSRGGVEIPVASNDRARFKWGIYRSLRSAKTDIVDASLLTRNYQLFKV